MAALYGNEDIQKLEENTFLYDLSKFRGVSAVLSRMPESSGVYAWYRRFKISDDARQNPQVFIDSILEELKKEHCSPRIASLPPLYKIKLQAEATFPKRKEAALKEIAFDSEFRELLFTIFESSILLQQPVYIGKARNLCGRIGEHLSQGSILRTRLEEAGHKIEDCRLLIILTSESRFSNNTNSSSIESLSDINTADSDTFLEDDSSTLDSDILDTELLVEDILSRLFLPSFALRYG